jgi:hypothetical protein
MTRNEIIADLKSKNPTMKAGNDTVGYVDFTPEEYEAQINEWADWVEADIKAKEDAEKAAVKAATDKAAATAKLAALGLTTDDLKALGLGVN